MVMMAREQAAQQVDRAVGVGLLVTGLLWMAMLAWGVWPLSYTWTLYAVVPGLVCLAAVPALGSRAAWLAAVGAALIAVGLLLGALGLTNGWPAWPAAVVLAVVVAPGLGLMLAGRWFGAPALGRRGRRLAWGGASLAALVALGAGVVGLLGGMGGEALVAAGPLVLISAGAALWLRR